MRVSWRTELPQWLLIAGMLLLAAATWSWAPDRIPVHWNVAGQVDRYGEKAEGLLAIPLLTVALYVLLLVLPRIDPGRANYPRFAGAYNVIRIGLVAVMAGVYGVVHLWIRGVPVDVSTVVPLLVGALFVVLGDLMGKIRPNWFVGIRTPWTLSSKSSWTKTHRLGGWVFIALGIGIIATGILRNAWWFGVVMGGAGVLLVWMVVYSYLVWRDDPDKTAPAGTLPAEDQS